MSEATAQLEKQLKAERELVERRDMAQRLHNNADFRKLITEYYLLIEPARLAAMSGDPILSPQERADALAMAQAAGHFKRFMSATFQMGNLAEDNIRQINLTLDEVRAEELAE